MMSVAAAIVSAGAAFASLPAFAQMKVDSTPPAPPTQAAIQATTATNAVLNNPAAAAEPLVL